MQLGVNEGDGSQMSKRKWYDEKAKRREEELILLGLDPEKDSARCPPPSHHSHPGRLLPAQPCRPALPRFLTLRFPRQRVVHVAGRTEPKQ